MFNRPCFRATTILFALALPLQNVARAAGDDSSKMSVRFAYFDLKQIRSSFPDSVTFEQLRYRGEDQLQAAAAHANRLLKQFSETKHSDQEILAKSQELQADVNFKTKAFVQQLTAANLNLTEKIKQAADTVAKNHGVDTVIDANGVYFGGSRVLESGIDVTEDMNKLLGTSEIETQ